MTESSPVASPLVQVRHTPRRLAFFAATVSLLASVSAAAALLTTQGHVWDKDLFAAAFWALPLALVILVTFYFTLDQLPSDSPVRQDTVVAPVGGLVGVAWAFIVFLFLTGGIQGSFDPLSGWIATGVVTLIYAVTPPVHRMWTAPILIATVLGAALIGLGAFASRV